MTTLDDIVVISGGTATNSLVTLFQSLSGKISYVLPISDNGGSTSEIIRILGGPAIGDIRSRITRLIPDEGFRSLLSYRLSEDGEEAKNEWTSIVDGTHHVWDDIEIQCKEMVRSFLIHVHMELLKKSRNPSTNFKFELASIGNLLVTGVRLFVGSLDSAIELIIRMTRIDPKIKIIPCLNTNYTYHISAQLVNGVIITGQSQISHPLQSNESRIQSAMISSTSVDYYDTSISGDHPLFSASSQALNNSIFSNHEDVPYQHPDLLISQLKFSKEANSPLESPIKRIFYINPYGEEIHPKANSRTIKSLNRSKAIVYSIGSLMTSIIPVLILKGIGMAIKKNPGKKILLLNGNLDRETFGLTALDFIGHIYEAIRYSFEADFEDQSLELAETITHLVYLRDSEIKVDVRRIESLGIKCIEISRDDTLNEEIKLYDLVDLQQKLDHIINK